MIDWDKPVWTKGAKKIVEIIYLNGPGDQPIIGIHDGAISQWSRDGIYFTDGSKSNSDLENIPEAKKIYKYLTVELPYTYPSKPPIRFEIIITGEAHNILAICYSEIMAKKIIELLNGENQCIKE